jgi:hypothetical protein
MRISLYTRTPATQESYRAEANNWTTQESKTGITQP